MVRDSISVSVVIRCRNEEAHIARLLTGLARQRRRPNEIILVDSGSTDATLAIASAFPVRVINIPPEDFSFGASCNLGCDVATGEVVVFISAHCFPVYDTWLEHMVEPFAVSDIALTYGRQLGTDRARYSERRLFARWFPAESTPRQRHPFCNNANAAIRRAVWEGGLRYDEQLTGLEDLDWAKRAIEAGNVLSYVASAPVIHLHDESFAQVVNRYRREAIAHKQIYDEQAMGLATVIRLAGANILSDLFAARREGCLIENATDIPRFRAAQFWGTYRGFSQSGPVAELLRQRFFFPEDVAPGDTPADLRVPGDPIDYDEPVGHAEFTP